MGDGRCPCCCVSYRARVTCFAVINAFVAAFQLIVPLISTGFMAYFKASRQDFHAQYILHENTMSLFERIPSIVLKPLDSRKITIAEIGLVTSPLQSDIHVWATWLFFKLILFIYSLLLYCGARKRNYNLILSWFALSLPMALHSLLLLLMDFCLGLMTRKPFNFQIFQYVMCCYQVLGLLFVYFFLRRIHFHRGIRYPEFKRETDTKFRDPSSLHL